MIVNTLKDSPDNVYYNISIPHDNSISDHLTEAVYTAYKTTPIVPKGDDYYASIIRFTIPLDTIPLMIMPIIPTLGNIYTTPMIIGIRDFVSGNYYSTNLIFDPNANNLKPVIQQGTKTQIITPWHYVYDYETLINMYNTALLSVFTAYNTANPGNPHSAFPCPFFSYDASTQLISLVAHVSWAWGPNNLINPTNPATQVIYVNYASLTYLDGMLYKGYNDPNVSADQPNFAFKIYNTGINGFPVNNYPTIPTYLKMSQDFSTLFLWNCLHKILIVTHSIPIVNEQIPILNNANPDIYNGFPVLSDFVPTGTNAGDSKEIAFYYPQSQYRLIDIISSAPLNKINIQIYWQDKNNNIYPLYISDSQAIEIKLAFIKKSLYKNNSLTNKL